MGRDREVGEVPTVTLAEIYAQQGHLERARDMYRHLVERGGDDARLRRRLLELETAAVQDGAAADGPRSALELLEGLLTRIRKERRDVLR